MNRRSILKHFTALAGAPLFSGLSWSAFAKTVSKTDTTEIITLSDGNLRLPLSFLFPEVPKDEVEELLARELVEENFVEPALNLTLLKHEGRVVLFDAGSGPNFMPSAGMLNDSLEAANVSPEEITDVIFTHGHPDHLWGILDDFDDVLFPEAVLHFPRREFDFWMDDGLLATMPEERQAFVVGAKNRLEAMDEQISLFEPGAEIVSGVEAFDTNGHTPGHTSFILHSGAEPVMVIGDALTNHVVSFQRPDWPSGSDHDPEQGIKTRKTLLDRIASEKIRIIGYHLPNEGVGYAEKSGNAYRFVKA